MDLSLKRIFAYIIDIIIVTLITSMIMCIPKLYTYQKEYNEVFTKYVEFSKSNDKDNKDIIIDYNQEMYNKRAVSSIVSTLTLIAYFGLLEYFMDGQTFGKKLLKIKVVSNKKDNTNVGNHIIKVIILNNILFTGIAYIILYTCNKEIFYYSTYIISLVQSGLLLAIVAMIILRKDGRAIHDILSNTKVIDLKENSN